MGLTAGACSDGATDASGSDSATITAPEDRGPPESLAGATQPVPAPTDGPGEASSETGSATSRGSPGSATSSAARPWEKVAQGTLPDGARWSLEVERQASGRQCQKYSLQLATGSGGASSGCDYQLPLDLAQSISAGHRAAFGPVTTAATTVVLKSADGTETRSPTYAAAAGWGRAFYVAFVPGATRLTSIVALDAAGNEVARFTPPADEEDAIQRATK